MGWRWGWKCLGGSRAAHPHGMGVLVRHQLLSHLGQDLQASGAHMAPNPERKAWVSFQDPGPPGSRTAKGHIWRDTWRD